jgi:hypothetical protein
MQTNQELCGCSGPGQPAGENRPLYELKHLIAMLERREAEQRRQAEKKGGE